MSARLSDKRIARIAATGDAGKEEAVFLALEVQERRVAERPIPVSERLPDFGVDVLGWDRLCGMWELVVRVPEGASWYWAPSPNYEITHWRALPPAPPEPR